MPTRRLYLLHRELLVVAVGMLLSCGGGTDGPTVVPATPELTTVTVTLSATSVPMGQSITASAAGVDQAGSAIGLGAVTWSSATPAIATVSSTGTVTGVTPGTALITAAVGAKQGSQPVTVISTLPVGVVTPTPTTLSLIVGGTQAIGVTERDTAGNLLAGRAVTWNSSAPGVASVSSSGVVTGVALGSATITATSEGKSAAIPVSVVSAIASITLAAAGQAAVFLDSPTFSESIKLQPGAQYLVAVVNTDVSATIKEDYTISGEFAAAASPPPSSPAPGSAGRPVMPRQGPMLAVTAGARSQLARMRQLEQNHLRMLEQNRRVYRQFGNPGSAWARARANRPGASSAGGFTPSPPISTTIGTVNRVYVANTFGGGCTAVDSIGARTVAVGVHVVVVADTNRTKWPQSFRPDSAYYQTFADEFDQVTWPHLIANIGNPLAYDAQLSNAGRITVTFTPVLNNIGGGSDQGVVVAFVNSCDFFPFATTGPNADYSNQTEMFYSFVPAANGYDVATWKNAVRATAAHEAKHLVSMADRIINNSGDFEEIWLEEGLAQVSGEIWERNFSKATWKGAANFLQTAACEINLGPNAPCDINSDKPVNLVASHLPFLFSYLESESTANSEGLGVDTHSNYGAGWTISRWSIDQYAAPDEGTFIKALINEPTLVGLANLSQHTSQPIPLLLVYWNLATAIFETPTFVVADARLTVPSFNFADIFNFGQTKLTCGGMRCGLFTDSGIPAYPVQPLNFSNGVFSRILAGVPGTSALFFLVSSSASGIETLKLRNATGGALAAGSGLRVAVLRVQ